MSNLVPAGRYMAKATSAMCDETPNKGTPYVRVMFEIQEGEHAARTVEWTGWLTEKTQERTIDSLLYCGWHGDDIGSFNSDELNGLDSNFVEIEVVHEASQNDPAKVYAKVAWVNKKRSLKVSQMDKAQTSAFGAAYKGLVAARRATVSVPVQDTGTDFPHGANAPAKAAPQKSF